MNQSLRVVAVLTAKAGKEQQVEQVLRACVQPSRAEDGCLSYDLNRCIEQAGRFVFVERWASHEAIALHRQMPHYTAMAKALGELLSDRQVYVLEALAEDGESAVGSDVGMAG
ncbi:MULTISPECIES: putative quinol monooxygenase [Pseudomonas]|uniref:Quinol monooxygenase n=1 Tax=Pseudomonas spirodelae TaxID=3101751 RepID=A0ABU5PD82_9PSED|nr:MULTISPECIES: putative quinol monooxygenase [unclassified Pseudomonas]MDD2159089.1 putative quinol monooxygenase [Pseudomonas sp. MIL19]MEA1607631.1 putative quinol monooxygenase [Pseudomonas sp. T5W1]